MESAENHRYPLSQPAKHLKNDQESASTNYKPFPPPPNRRSSKALVYILLTIVILSIAFLIFGLVALRVKTIDIQISRASVENLRYDSASLNMTVVASIRMHNTNLFGRFKFGDGNTTLLYGNAAIGSASIDGGRIGSRDRREMSVAVKAAGSGGELAGNLSRDVGLGLVKLKSYAELRGEVRVVKVIKRLRTAVMNCTMDLNLTTKAIQDLSCQ